MYPNQKLFRLELLMDISLRLRLEAEAFAPASGAKLFGEVCDTTCPPAWFDCGHDLIVPEVGGNAILLFKLFLALSLEPLAPCSQFHRQPIARISTNIKCRNIRIPCQLVINNFLLKLPHFVTDVLESDCDCNQLVALLLNGHSLQPLPLLRPGGLDAPNQIPCTECGEERNECQHKRKEVSAALEQQAPGLAPLRSSSRRLAFSRRSQVP